MRRPFVWFPLFALMGLLAMSCAPRPAGAGVPRLLVRGSQILSPSGAPIDLRGYNWNEYVEQPDAAANRAEGANVVRMTLWWHIGRKDGCDGHYPGSKFDSYSPSSPGSVDPALLRQLDQKIQWATSQGLWVDLAIRGGDCEFWTSPAVQQQFVSMWSLLAARYKNTPYIGMYELLSEPHPKGLGDGNRLAKPIFERAIAAIRAIDPATPILVGPAPTYNIRNVSAIVMRDQHNIIYTGNFFELSDYVKEMKSDSGGGGATHGGYPGYFTDTKGSIGDCDYPGRGGAPVMMDKAFLAGLIQCLVKVRQTYDVPVFVQQVGVRSGTPGSMAWANDVLDVLNADHIGWTYWIYRTRPGNGRNSLHQNDIGVIYEDAGGQWRQKSDWIGMLSAHMRAR
jgi:hypothetical protein